MPIPVFETSFMVNCEAEMQNYASSLAQRLNVGDTLLLEGPIGSGKTSFARAAIQELVGSNEHVPSPTYTLIQTYETDSGEIWHADLYRLGDSSELVELGLDDAIGKAIAMIEWPDRLPQELTPSDALRINFNAKGETRILTFSSRSERWNSLLK